MLLKQEAFPKMLGTSFRTGQRLLRIGRAPDPVKAERAEWGGEAETKREGRLHNRQTSAQNVTDGSSLEAVVAAVKLLTTEEFRLFKDWFRGF
jgi:hypothetical protein